MTLVSYAGNAKGGRRKTIGSGGERIYKNATQEMKVLRQLLQIFRTVPNSERNRSSWEKMKKAKVTFSFPSTLLLKMLQPEYNRELSVFPSPKTSEDLADSSNQSSRTRSPCRTIWHWNIPHRASAFEHMFSVVGRLKISRSRLKWYSHRKRLYLSPRGDCNFQLHEAAGTSFRESSISPSRSNWRDMKLSWMVSSQVENWYGDELN